MNPSISGQLLVEAAAELVAAAALRAAAGALLGCQRRGSAAATAYLCAAAGVLLSGQGFPAASIQNALLLSAVAAALTPGSAVYSALLLALGSADWLAGTVLLAAPLALLAAGYGGISSSGGGNSSSGSGTANSDGGSSSRKSSTVTAKQLAGYCCCVAATLAALAQARQLLPPPMTALLNGWLGLAGWRAALPAVQPADLQLDPLAWVGARAAQQPSHLRSALVLPAASLQPGLGLHWYLLAQAFPQFRGFFIYSLRALPAALMLPLALRFPRRPALLLAAGSLARCMLHPRPQLSMATLWVGLLPLAAPQLAGLAGLPWMALGMGAALLLSASAADLWLGSGGGNANFLYGMNLLWAGLQAALFLRMLRAAARQEVAPARESAAAGAAAAR